MARRTRRARRHGSRSDDPRGHRRDHPRDLERDLRLRPAPLRGARPVPGRRATSSDTSRWGSSRRSAPRSPRSAPGDRVVIPFNVSCGHCCMCEHGLMSQCETTQVHELRHRRSAARLHQALRPSPGRPGRVPARAAGAVRADQGPPRAARRPLRLPLRRPADRLAGRRIRRPAATAAACSCSGSARSARCAAAIAQHRGCERVLAVDLVPERLERARAHGVETFNLDEHRRPRPEPCASAPTAAARTR